MIPLFSSQQVREVDSYAIEQCGYPGLVLMENASLEIFNQIKKNIPHFSANSSIVIICGKGNNGGDGFACARHFLNNGNRVVVLHIAKMEEMSEDASANFVILTRLKSLTDVDLKIKRLTSINDISPFADSDIIIDAILGSGSYGPLKDIYSRLIPVLNNLPGHKVAIDIPTGLNADTGSGDLIFKAELTVTLGELKPGLFIGNGYENCGKIVKGSIGVPPSFYDVFDINDYLVEPEDALNYLPFKKASIDKYSAGKVLNISGSGKYPGAPMLVTSAAFKSGAGSVILAFPKSVRSLVTGVLAEAVFDFYDDKDTECLSPDTIIQLKDRIEWADTVVMGPGLGRTDLTIEAVKKYLKTRGNKKTILDADALFAISGKEYEKFDLDGVVLTPHLGEFSKLINVPVSEIKKNLLSYGKEFAQKTGALLVLKGAPTIIFNPDGEALINTAGNSGMAKFGSGDALSGILAGFMSQEPDIEEACVSGVYFHSFSADLLLKEYSEFGFTATDIINNLPKSINFLRNSVV